LDERSRNPIQEPGIYADLMNVAINEIDLNELAAALKE
jgi:hypothetical protein